MRAVGLALDVLAFLRASGQLEEGKVHRLLQEDLPTHSCFDSRQSALPEPSVAAYVCKWPGCTGTFDGLAVCQAHEVQHFRQMTVQNERSPCDHSETTVPLVVDPYPCSECLDTSIGNASSLAVRNPSRRPSFFRSIFSRAHIVLTPWQVLK